MDDVARVAAMSPAELSLMVVRLAADVGVVRGENVRLRARVVELEGELEKRTRAGKRQAAPFSKGKKSDPDGVDGPEPRTAGRKAGAEHGKHGHRELPDRDPDRCVPVALPGLCPHCGGNDVDHAKTVSQFVEDLPPLAVIFTEFLVEVGACRDCGGRVQGRHPDQASDALGAAGVQVGPHAKAFACWLHYELGLSFGKCSSVLARFGITVTASALVQACAKIGRDLAATAEAVRVEVNSATEVVMDETGWRVDGAGRWLWVATCANGTYYRVCDGRSHTDAHLLLDADYDGILIVDGYSVYRNHYPRALRQTCLAHLLRRTVEALVIAPAGEAFTLERVKTILLDALDARSLPVPERQELIEDLTELVELLGEGHHQWDPTRTLVKHLNNELAHDSLFTFLDHHCDATNWRGETAIRPAVVNRKVYGGNKTDTGAVTQGRIMTVLRTGRQQAKDMVTMLTDHARAPNPAGLILAFDFPNTLRYHR